MAEPSPGSRWRRAAPAAVLALCLAAVAPPAAAQGPPEMVVPVGVAESIDHPVRRTLTLSGDVESRRASLVASEVAGLVVDLVAREGEKVSRGQTLVRLRRQTAELRLAAARAELEEARAMQRLAEARRRRARGLFEELVISQQELDDAISEFDASQGRVDRLAAEVERLTDELERTVVRAPFDGVVVAEHTAVGEWVGAGDAVAEMVDVADLEVTVEVPEQHFAGLSADQEVAVEVASLPGEVLPGTIRAVVPRADPEARTFPLKVSLPNPRGAIGVGMLARVKVPIGSPRPAVLVPKDAVVAAGPSRSVFVVGEGDRVRPVAVQLGAADGEWVAVEGDLEAGERVVIQGNERLQPGQKVAPRPVEVPAP